MCVVMALFLQLLVFSMLFFKIKSSIPPDMLRPGQSIKDGQTLVSNGESFELGFFSPGSSSNRYLGIWYKKVSTGTVVWVANREIPISDKSGVVNITEKGVIVLLNGTKQVVWSSTIETTTTSPPRNPIAQLLDTGNFIVRDGNESNDTDPGNFLWQSFHFPGDTSLPGMKIGRNLVTGQDWSLTSWKNLDDPARGEYTYSIDTNGYPQSMLRRKGNGIQFRSGCWNGIRFTGAPRMSPTNQVFRYEFVITPNEVYYKAELLDKSVLSRLVVNASGFAGRLTWIDQTHSWVEFFHFGQDQCDNYNICGANAQCSMDAFPLCHCIEGFQPKSVTQWNVRDWLGGCVRIDSLRCVQGEGFVKLPRMKLPDSSGSWFNLNTSLKECKELCLKNCSCVAFANADVRNGGSGCVLWFGDLLDMRVYPDSGQDLYVRMAKSYMEHIAREEESKRAKRITIIVCAILLAVGIIAAGLVLCVWKRKQRKLRNQENIKSMLERDYSNQGQNEDMELPIFDLATIAKATDQFSINNKLGEGGFGPVFKGLLFDGHEIAVKRLSTNSGQGLQEFKNEVLLIAKLQHRNLVRLLGCCIRGDERMLIYEYMPNKSLDYFIFDPSGRKQLDWKKRMNIIDGIARGLLYLHQDSRLRIIHRDLKTSNVLLDHHMTPKISDFGLARIVGGDQVEIETNRVVGTFGYIAPEYAADGLFSVKSDVFSFGVIVLEIVSGRRSKGFFSHHHHQNLVGHAWRMWKEGKPLELMDDALEQTCELPEVVRCIHIGLLCVQQQPEDRPNMSTVILMLGSESSLPQPKQPGFYSEKRLPPETESSSSICKSTSSYDVTVSILDPR